MQTLQHFNTDKPPPALETPVAARRRGHVVRRRPPVAGAASPWVASRRWCALWRWATALIVQLTVTCFTLSYLVETLTVEFVKDTVGCGGPWQSAAVLLLAPPYWKCVGHVLVEGLHGLASAVRATLGHAMATVLRDTVRAPIVYVYLKGPSPWGYLFWNGLDDATICAQLNPQMDAAFWMTHRLECRNLVERRIEGIAVGCVALLFLYLALCALHAYISTWTFRANFATLLRDRAKARGPSESDDSD